MIINSADIRLPPKWIELNINKRECTAFIPLDSEEANCHCGRKKVEHDEDILAHPGKSHRGEEWTPSRHTTATPTDAYGQIVFEGEHHPNKSRFVRLSYDTNPELVIQLMTFVWGLEMPKLVITVRGGTKNFDLSPRLGRILQVGLLKAAKSTSAWIFTNGLNRGVTRHIGNALGNERWLGFKRGRCVSIGIAPWGVVEHRNDLIGRNRDRVYSPLAHPSSKFVLLNPRHSNFLLVDNGSVGKMGGDMYFRKRLEKYIASYPMSPHRGCDTPIVCVVIEGGIFTLRTIAENLHEEPSIPVVVFGHTGRTSDLLTYVMKKCDCVKDLEPIKVDLMKHMMRIYEINYAQGQLLFGEIKKIVARKNLLTVYIPHQTEEESFDSVLLASIFRSQHWTPLQQLSLTLAWDRVDIANNEVFVYGRDWSRDHLEHGMMEALVSDRLDFVNLLLEHGLNMQLFLTPARLEGLYSLERTHSVQMRTLLFELGKIRASQQKFASHHSGRYDRNLTLHDVGLAMSHMMGHIYKSKYIHLRGIRDQNSHSGSTPIAVDEDPNTNVHGFTQPFDDLFIWAILTKRHQMALLLWCHGPGALAKALVAVKLNRYLAEELTATEKTNMASDFQEYAEEWETLSLELLDSCFRQDPKVARQLLTMELDHWSKQTCLTLAVMANHRMLLGHPCCQILLADLWMGALNLRKNATLKIVLGIIIFPLVFAWEYKSTEELQLLPHQERHDLNLLPSSGGRHPESSYDGESLHTFNNSRSRGSHASFASLFQNTGQNVNQGQGKSADDSHGKSISPHSHYRGGDSGPNIDLIQVSNKLQEYKYYPNNPEEHHHKHTHFHEKNQILDSGAAGSFIFDQYHDHRPRYPSYHGRGSQNYNGSHNNRHRTFMPMSNQGQEQSSFVTTKHNLSAWSKFVEFQKAPVTNFYRHTIAYIVFVSILAYVILVPQDEYHPSYFEIYIIAYVATHGCDIIREFICIDAYNWGQKWSEFRTNIFTLVDFGIVIFFMVGVGLRFFDYFSYGMLMYRVSSIYWNLRLYKYMGVHKFVGPKLVMMTRMLKHMAYFAMIICVVLIAFGIARESIRFPDNVPTWRNIAEAFLEPYVMMFGEVDTDALSPQCGEEDQPECPVGHWIIPLTWVIYMMVANILIVNVLIAVFNGIYSEVDAIALEVWMFQRFTFVMEFEQKPLLPPPFIIISHFYGIMKCCVEKCVLCICEHEIDTKSGEYEDGQPRVIMGNDHSLKSFLTSAEENMVFDFEEDNVDALNNTNESLRKLAGNQRSRNGPPLFGGGVGPGVGSTLGVGMDRMDKLDPKHGAIGSIQTNVREIMRELESQRYKIDKLVEILQVASEYEDDGIDAVVSTPSTRPIEETSQRQQVPVSDPPPTTLPKPPPIKAQPPSLQVQTPPQRPPKVNIIVVTQPKQNFQTKPPNPPEQR